MLCLLVFNECGEIFENTKHVCGEIIRDVIDHQYFVTKFSRKIFSGLLNGFFSVY